MMMMMMIPSKTHCCNLTNALTGPHHVSEHAAMISEYRTCSIVRTEKVHFVIRVDVTWGGGRHLHAARYAVEQATERCGDSFENLGIIWVAEEMKLSN